MASIMVPVVVRKNGYVESVMVVKYREVSMVIKWIMIKFGRKRQILENILQIYLST